MKKVFIIYWSGTGNTEEMARLIEEGAKEKGADAKIINVSQASIEDIKSADVIALGSPAMGAEVIEESEMEPFVESISGLVSGKSLGLFGSYGWGSGEWMTSWIDRMNGYGANVIGDGLIVNAFPENESAELCKEYGRTLAES